LLKLWVVFSFKRWVLDVYVFFLYSIHKSNRPRQQVPQGISPAEVKHGRLSTVFMKSRRELGFFIKGRMIKKRRKRRKWRKGQKGTQILSALSDLSALSAISRDYAKNQKTEGRD
jgi:hypothetical protein